MKLFELLKLKAAFDYHKILFICILIYKINYKNNSTSILYHMIRYKQIYSG